MTQNTVSPAQYRAAHNAATRINGAIASLQRIDSQTLNQDADAIAKLADFKQLLTSVYEQNKEIIALGDKQHESRPLELINKAASRLNAIPRDIELEQKTFAARLDTRKQKVEELSKRFSEAEIEKIVPSITQAEIDASAAIIAGLKAEAAAIEAFLADAPRYDTSLIHNTKLAEV
jgi:replicative DNA helicase